MKKKNTEMWRGEADLPILNSLLLKYNQTGNRRPA